MRKYLLLMLALACASTSDAASRPTHNFIVGPYNSGPEVTRTCMECHEKLTKAFMGTVHWTWGKKQSSNGKTAEYGKKNALGNSFCLALPSNQAGCTSCHAGYGWADGSFDFKTPKASTASFATRQPGPIRSSRGRRDIRSTRARPRSPPTARYGSRSIWWKWQGLSPDPPALPAAPATSTAAVGTTSSMESWIPRSQTRPGIPTYTWAARG